METSDLRETGMAGAGTSFLGRVEAGLLQNPPGSLCGFRQTGTKFRKKCYVFGPWVAHSDGGDREWTGLGWASEQKGRKAWHRCPWHFFSRLSATFARQKLCARQTLALASDCGWKPLLRSSFFLPTISNWATHTHTHPTAQRNRGGRQRLLLITHLTISKVSFRKLILGQFV